MRAFELPGGRQVDEEPPARTSDRFQWTRCGFLDERVT